MKKRELYYLIPESFEDYQNLPEDIREKIKEYTLREAVVKITENVPGFGNLEDYQNAQEALTELLNESGKDFPRQPFLINLGMSVMDKAEQFMDWLYDVYMKLAYAIYRRKRHE